MFLDFPMARNWLRDAGVWISIPIVFSSVTHEFAPEAFDCSDQVFAFHEITKSATLRAPEI